MQVYQIGWEAQYVQRVDRNDFETVHLALGREDNQLVYVPDHNVDRKVEKCHRRQVKSGIGSGLVLAILEAAFDVFVGQARLDRGTLALKKESQPHNNVIN